MFKIICLGKKISSVFAEISSNAVIFSPLSNDISISGDILIPFFLHQFKKFSVDKLSSDFI